MPSFDDVGGELVLLSLLCRIGCRAGMVVVCLFADGGGRFLLPLLCCRSRMPCGRRLLCGCQPMKLKQRDVPDSRACGMPAR